MQTHFDCKMIAETKTAEMRLYGAIGDLWDGVTDELFAKQLEEMGDVDQINLRLNSPGGFAEQGLAMMSMLRDHPAQVHVAVDGAAYSAATLLLLAGDHVVMNPGSRLMIHNPWSLSIGDYRAMQKSGERLEELRTEVISLYASRTGESPKSIGEWMDGEEYMSGETAVGRNFADQVRTLKPKEEVESRAAISAGEFDEMKEIVGNIPLAIRKRQLAVAKLQAGLSPDGKRTIDKPLTAG